jgi:hypothetical protein
MPLSYPQGLPQIDCGREIGDAGCFRFFEATEGQGEARIVQCAADEPNAGLAARRLAREVAIAPDFRGRKVAPFCYWSEKAGSALWHDDGLRPAIQQTSLARDGLGGKCCNFGDGDEGCPAPNSAARSQAASSNRWSMN